MPGNPLVRFDEGRGGRTFSVALSPTLPSHNNPCSYRIEAAPATGTNRNNWYTGKPCRSLITAISIR